MKIPIGFTSISPREVRLYTAFIDLKCFNTHGVICPKRDFRKCNRQFYQYWLNQLVSAKWVLQKGDCFHLKSYQEVWRSLGVTPFFSKAKGYHFPYFKISIESLSENRLEYIRQIRDIIYQHVINRKLRQVNHQALKKARKGSRQRTLKGSTKSNLKIFIPCSQVAGWFGSKSRTFGLNVRQKYLKQVIQEGGFDFNNGKVTRKGGFVIV